MGVSKCGDTIIYVFLELVISLMFSLGLVHITQHKKGDRRSPVFSVNNDHMRFLTTTSMVTVGVDSETTQSLSKTFGEGLKNQTITGLEADLQLEGVLSDSTNHLEGNIRTIEQTAAS